MSENDAKDQAYIEFREANAIDVKQRDPVSHDCAIPIDVISLRRARSVPELGSDANNYDDTRVPWKYADDMSSSGRYRGESSILSVRELIAPEDVACMRKQQDKRSILLFLEKKILHGTRYKDRNREILVKLLWQTVKFFKEKQFSDQQISTVLKLILSVHSFYLTNYWNTAEETYNYFYERVLSCTVMDPPKCAEIFTPNEAWTILEFFREIYLENIVLLNLACVTHYRIVVRFDDDRQG